MHILPQQSSQAIFGPNSSVKRVVVCSEDCPLVNVNRILAAGMKSTLETFGFFMRFGSLPCADALVNFIPHMAMLKELKLAFPRGLSTEAKSRILGAVEQSTSIQAIELGSGTNSTQPRGPGFSTSRDATHDSRIFWKRPTKMLCPILLCLPFWLNSTIVHRGCISS